MHHSPLGFWVLTRYEDVVGILRDPRFAKEPMIAAVAARLGIAPVGIGISMLDRDPPDHTRLRSLASKAFTPRVVEALRPADPADRRRLLDGVADARGTMDLIEQFAYPIPGQRHLRDARRARGGPRAVQGVVARHRARARQHHAAAGLRGGEAQRPGARGARRTTSGASSPSGGRRRAPTCCPPSSPPRRPGDKLSEPELVAMCILLLVAGHETTVNLIGNGTLALLRHPDQLRLLRERPDLIVTAVEELLRYDGPVQRTARTPSEDVTIGGRTIPKGEIVMPFIGAADRDPAQFREPERLDITRTDNRHIAFGLGHPLLPRRAARADRRADRDQHARCSAARSSRWPSIGRSIATASRCAASCRCRSAFEDHAGRAPSSSTCRW